MVLFAQQNTIKTAFRFSIIDFYFVTCFYSLYDICMQEIRNFLNSVPPAKQRPLEDITVSNGLFFGYPKIQLTS